MNSLRLASLRLASCGLHLAVCSSLYLASCSLYPSFSRLLSLLWLFLPWPSPFAAPFLGSGVQLETSIYILLVYCCMTPLGILLGGFLQVIRHHHHP